MPLDETYIQHLVSGWLSLQYATQGSSEFDASWWAFEEVDTLTQESPDDAWDFILATLSRDSSGKVLGMLSAGPLEDLLARHGHLIIDRVEAEARRNPIFAKLLGGVWQNVMSDEIWERVQAVWDRRGWDGNPEA